MSKCYFHESGKHLWIDKGEYGMYCACGAEI